MNLSFKITLLGKDRTKICFPAGIESYRRADIKTTCHSTTLDRLYANIIVLIIIHNKQAYINLKHQINI